MYLSSCTTQWQTIDIPTHRKWWFLLFHLRQALYCQMCAQLWGVKWCFTVILICISLITSGSKHLFNVHWTSIFHLLWNACLCLLAILYFLIFNCVSSLSGCAYYSHFMAFLFLVFYDVFWWVEVFNFNLILFSNHFLCDFHFVCLKVLHSSDIIRAFSYMCF